MHGHQGLNNLCFNYYEKKICNNYFNWGNSKDRKEKNLFCTTTIGKNLKKNN